MDRLVNKYVQKKNKEFKELEDKIEIAEAYYRERLKLITSDLNRYRRELISQHLVNCKQEISYLKKKLDKLYTMEDVERIVNEEKE